MKSDFLLTPILADEVSTGGVIVGSGVASTLLLFFGETATVMLPFFCVALVVILVDLIFGIRADTGANANPAISPTIIFEP